MIINAEKIKTKGVSLFKTILEKYAEVIVNFRGENKYIIIDVKRYLDLEDYTNKMICRKEHPEFIPKKYTMKRHMKRGAILANYEKKIDNMAFEMRSKKEVINANELKTKGVSVFNNLLNIDKIVVINVRGVSTYVVLRIEEYKKLLAVEQDFMYQKAVSKEEKFEEILAEDDSAYEFIKSLLESNQ